MVQNRAEWLVFATFVAYARYFHRFFDEARFLRKGGSEVQEMVEIITIEKAELIRLIDTSVAGAIEKAIHSSQPPQIMTKSEVAKYLKKSSATINRWMRKNGLPFHGVGRPTFNRTEVDAWLANY